MVRCPKDFVDSVGEAECGNHGYEVMHDNSLDCG